MRPLTLPPTRWVSEVRDSVQDKWPYLSLLPEQRGVQPCRAVGGVNTVVPLVVRVPTTSEGPDGNPEVALGYDVSNLGFNTVISNSKQVLCVILYCSRVDNFVVRVPTTSEGPDGNPEVDLGYDASNLGFSQPLPPIEELGLALPPVEKLSWIPPSIENLG